MMNVSLNQSGVKIFPNVNIAGQKGEKGDPGDTGPIGLTGPKGDTGAAGSSETLVVYRCMNLDGLSDGVETSATYFKQFTVAEDCVGIKFVYANHQTTTAGDVANPDPITIKASVDLGGGVLIPIRFNGLKTVTIDGGGFVTSDEIGITLTKAATFFTRTYVSVAASRKWVKGTSNWINGEGKHVGADVTEGGALTIVSDNGGYYKPVAIIGRISVKSQPMKSALLVGDSIMWGTGDSTTSRDYMGYTQTALYSKRKLMVIARPSELVQGFDVVTNRMFRIQRLKHCDFVVSNYGINDIRANRTLAQVKADLLTMWNMFDKLGLPVFHNTITPATTSTDAWATTGNQTPEATNAVRVQVNDWIRTLPAPLSGYFEVADLAETARNSGIWRAGYTSDGLHPNATGHTALVTGIDVTKLP
ncbi:GDSL-type esterase/lipase family protein [Paenibacillus sp. OV219]|uniref:GDSL-type esterase/lipase family protein n=1 Tax=Paenibacillus sp. OV219 TaxID=1884377 RepID=UPI0008ACBE5B|nr:GDSL-type esterase/lipase family protein [Paenibacillus sp. OV219]SEN19815.1 Lysophospholipase L1 [Paenibacillus sp. OV219]